MNEGKDSKARGGKKGEGDQDGEIERGKRRRKSGCNKKYKTGDRGYINVSKDTISSVKMC